MIIPKGTSKRFFKDTTSLKKFLNETFLESKSLLVYQTLQKALLSKESGLQCHIKDIIDCGSLFFLVSFE